MYKIHYNVQCVVKHYAMYRTVMKWFVLGGNCIDCIVL